MAAFFTKTGDDGTTGLLGDERISKSDLRMETIGTLDELSAILGLAKNLAPSSLKEHLTAMQRRIYEIMAELAATKENVKRFSKINEDSIKALEGTIGEISKSVKIPASFILPGDNTASAVLSMARTTARRAERRLVELMVRDHIENPFLLQYLNRLSSCLYLFELYTVQKDPLTSLSFSKG